MTTRDRVEPRFYEKQADGSLTPLEGVDEWLVRRVASYEWMRGRHLSLDEIKFIVGTTF